MPEPTYDVLIAGAGPGGTTTALTLADSGLKVALVDKATFPRDKVCGDALSGKVCSVLKYTSPQALEDLYAFPEKLGSWGIRFFSPRGEALDVPFKGKNRTNDMPAPGFIAKRADFDHFLLQQVESHPHIKVIQSYAVKEIAVDTVGVRISDGHQSLHGQLLIGADGAHSQVAKQLSQIRVEKNHYSAGLRVYYRGIQGFHPDNFIELHYLKSLLPGYFWIFPLANGWANVGLGMLSSDVKRHRINIKARLQEIITEHPLIAPRFSKAEALESIQGFGLPLGSKKRPLSGERFMLVGDAASLIDPFTGEGIGNAMLSGRIAAKQAINSFAQQDFSAQALRAYDQAVYAKIWTELRLSRTLQKLVNYPRLFNFVVRKANRNPALQELLTSMFDDLDLRKSLSQPSFYWRLLWG